MERRFGVASEEGSSSLPGLIGATRYPIGPSGLTLVRCPCCGSEVVECRSWRQGGHIFFKCEDNEQFVPNCCTFFKWIKSYKKMVEAMELNYPDEAVSDVAMPMVADIVEKRPNSVTDAKIEKLARLMQILVFMNCSTLVFVLIWQQRTSNPFRFRQRSKFSHITKGHRFRSKFRHYRFRFGEVQIQTLHTNIQIFQAKDMTDSDIT
uniref:Zinc finger GRF-type domain-containing protein n=1 Tax=Oryza glumipatula TaxID=40148 RepID=A0A0D9ZYQ7_9ORYZ